MTDKERDQLRAIAMRMRVEQQRLFDLQGLAIQGLTATLAAVRDTHEAMMPLFQATNDLDDLANS